MTWAIVLSKIRYDIRNLVYTKKQYWGKPVGKEFVAADSINYFAPVINTSCIVLNGTGLLVGLNIFLIVFVRLRVRHSHCLSLMSVSEPHLVLPTYAY